MSLILIVLSILLNTQSAEWVCFKHEQNEVYIDVKDGVITVRQNPDEEDLFWGEELFSSSYVVRNDTLVTLITLNYSFVFSDDGSKLISLTDIGGAAKKGDIFYGTSARFPNGSYLRGKQWKNGKRNGVWIYQDKSTGLFYRLYYKEGVVERQEEFRLKWSPPLE